MQNMKAGEWIEFLQEQGVEIEVMSHGYWLLSKNSGCYGHNSDKIFLTQKLSKEVLFHELVHWTGNRLDRDMNTLIRSNVQMEESIAWETTRLMVKKFGGGNSHYYKCAPEYNTMHSPKAKLEGKRAYHFICKEFGLDA